MSPGSGMTPDIRDAPAYSYLEASRYLGIPQATLRPWARGRSRGCAASPPLIRAPSGADNKLSFNNLVEAHVLRALRAGNAVRMAAVRNAVSYGRPTVAGSGVSTEALARRIDAGESIEGLAWDYGLEIAQIEAAIVYERAARADPAAPPPIPQKTTSPDIYVNPD